MALPKWGEEPISKSHRRADFDCGDRILNEYLTRFARQNHESGGAKTFVAAARADHTRVLGYYTISPATLAFDRVPATVTRKLGRYEVPVFRLARLAVALDLQGRGLGGQLLLAAGSRALKVAAQVGGDALTIDAKSLRAAQWYSEFGALPLVDDPLTLVLPLATIEQALGQ